MTSDRTNLETVPRSPGQLRAWLDRYRDWMLQLSVFDGYPANSIPELNLTVLKGSPTDRVGREVVRRDKLWERLAVLAWGIEQLEPAQRLMLKYRYFDQASISWMCRRTRFSGTQVKQLIREGLEALFVVLGGEADKDKEVG